VNAQTFHRPLVMPEFVHLMRGHCPNRRGPGIVGEPANRLALDALEMAIFAAARDLAGLVHPDFREASDLLLRCPTRRSRDGEPIDGEFGPSLSRVCAWTPLAADDGEEASRRRARLALWRDEISQN